MASIDEYAQLSSRVYSAVFDSNRTPVSLGWEQLYWQADTTMGFSAGAYRKGNEIVISYTGTNQDKLTDFGLANIPLALGLPSPQLVEAISFYEKIKSSYANSDTKITFTGHSLGGGLASLMAVFFNKPATIFDPAPFQPSAISLSVLASVQTTLEHKNLNWHESGNEVLWRRAA